MGLRPGQTNNPAGRPPGSKNIKSEQWEQLGNYLISNSSAKVIEYLESIKDKQEYFDAFLKVINYFKPKMASSTQSVDVTSQQPKISIDLGNGKVLMNENHELYKFAEAVKGGELSDDEREFNPDNPIETFRKILNDEK